MTDVDDDDDDFVDPQWTDEARARFTQAASALQSVLAEHAAVVAAAYGQRHVPGILEANARLAEAADAYSEAQVDLTGMFAQFELPEDDDDDDEDELGEEPPPANIMVLRRSLYAIADEAAVLETGRQAYLRVFPDDIREDAEADVDSIGRALYQIAHDAGWDALDQAAGIEPSVSTTWVLSNTVPFEPFEGDFGQPPFPLADTVREIYREDDLP